MPERNRFRLRFSLANARRSASSWGHMAKMRAESRLTQLHRFEQRIRINSCGISSLVETIILRRICVRLLTISARSRYHYCSINLRGRNSENCWSICGNPAPWNCADFLIPLTRKHLDLFQNGPPLANYVPPARVLMYWCPEP